MAEEEVGAKNGKASEDSDSKELDRALVDARIAYLDSRSAKSMSAEDEKMGADLVQELLAAKDERVLKVLLGNLKKAESAYREGSEVKNLDCQSPFSASYCTLP